MTTRRSAAPATEVPATGPAPAEATQTPGVAEPDAAAPGYEQEGAPEGERPEPALDEAGNGQGMPEAAPPVEPTVRGARLLDEMRVAEDRWLAECAERHAALRAAQSGITARLAAEADAMTTDAMRAPRLGPLTRSAAEALAAEAANNEEAVLAGIWAAYVACQPPAEHTHRVMSDAEQAAHMDTWMARAAWRAPHRWPAQPVLADAT